MPSYQIQAYDKVMKRWTQAYGLKPRSFLKADGHEPESSEDAIQKFLYDSRLCKRNLILVCYPDFGSAHIIAGVNGLYHARALAHAIKQDGKHPKLLELAYKRSALNCTPLEDEGFIDELTRVIGEKIYPNEITERLDS